MTSLNWTTSREDRTEIARIVKRAIEIGLCRPANRTNLTMDLTACHLNGTPLDLARLADFPQPDFIHRCSRPCGARSGCTPGGCIARSLGVHLGRLHDWRQVPTDAGPVAASRGRTSHRGGHSPADCLHGVVGHLVL